MTTAVNLIQQSIQATVTLDLINLQNEVERLQKRLSKYEVQTDSRYAGTRFHHFDGLATLAFRTEGLLTKVGVTLVALPRFRDAFGKVAIDDLLRSDPRYLRETQSIEQFNRPLGRMISHGRALKQRNMSITLSAEEAKDHLLRLRKRQPRRLMAPVYRMDNNLRPDRYSYLREVQVAAEFQKAVRGYFVEKI